MTSLIKLKRIDADHFQTLDGRFLVNAERTESGASLRGWMVVDSTKTVEPDSWGRGSKSGRVKFAKNRAEACKAIEETLRTELPPEKLAALKVEIKRILHSARDTMRIVGKDTKTQRFDNRHADYGQAFGILTAMHVLGYGEFGGVNVKGTLSNMMWDLEDEVLKEEGFGPDGDGKCEVCFHKYGRDDARPRGEPLSEA